MGFKKKSVIKISTKVIEQLNIYTYTNTYVYV